MTPCRLLSTNCIFLPASSSGCWGGWARRDFVGGAFEDEPFQKDNNVCFCTFFGAMINAFSVAISDMIPVRSHSHRKNAITVRADDQLSWTHVHMWSWFLCVRPACSAIQPDHAVLPHNEMLIRSLYTHHTPQIPLDSFILHWIPWKSQTSSFEYRYSTLPPKFLRS